MMSLRKRIVHINDEFEEEEKEFNDNDNISE
jgi:hypothetical protein